jgi:uncharacterized protein with von Willebrand factor type A (vWA) domain
VFPHLQLSECAEFLGDVRGMQLVQRALHGGKVRRVILALDISGSMGGPRIRKATDAMRHIYDSQVRMDTDWISMLVFNTQVVVVQQLAPKSVVHPQMLAFFDNVPKPSHQTVLWDAIGRTFDILSLAGHRDTQDIIVVLTDGDDTHSRDTTPDSLQRITASSKASLFVVGIGHLNCEPILKQICSSTPHGKVFTADTTDQIESTFKQLESELEMIQFEQEAKHFEVEEY